MQSSDRCAFQELLTGAMAFYGQALSTYALGVWWNACQPFEVAQVQRALSQHAIDADRGAFPPKPADVVRQIMGTRAERAMLAWGKVLEAIGRVGGYDSVVFDDPVVHCAIADLGGWSVLCRSRESELPFLQRRFCDAYQTYSGSGPPSNYPACLVGEHEMKNRGAGAISMTPVFIGDPAACRAVLQGGGMAGRLQLTRPTGSSIKVLSQNPANDESRPRPP